MLRRIKSGLLERCKHKADFTLSPPRVNPLPLQTLLRTCIKTTNERSTTVCCDMITKGKPKQMNCITRWEENEETRNLYTGRIKSTQGFRIFLTIVVKTLGTLKATDKTGPIDSWLLNVKRCNHSCFCDTLGASWPFSGNDLATFLNLQPLVMMTNTSAAANLQPASLLSIVSA